MLSCPKCNVPVGEMDPRSGVVETVCSRCHFAFRFFFGKLAGRNSRQVTIQRQTTKRSGSYRREYELLRVELPSGALEVFSFSVNGRDDWILVRRGDYIRLTYTIDKAGELEDLVAILDSTTGDNYAINKPGANAAAVAFALAFVAFLAGVWFFWFPVDLTFWPSVGLAFLLAIGSFVGLLRVFEPRRKLAPAEKGALSERHQTLAQKQSLLAMRDKATRDLNGKQDLSGRLRQLHGKMQVVGGDLYRARSEKLASAIAVVEQQMEIDRRLIAGYDRLVTMIEIELDSGAVASALPDSVAQDLSVKLSELSGVERQHQELELHLGANDEVERLLQA